MNQCQLNFYGELLSNHGEEVASRYASLVESPSYWESAPTSPHLQALKSRRRRRQFLTVPVLKERILRIVERQGHVTIPIAKLNISDLSYMGKEQIETIFREIAAEKDLRIIVTRKGFLGLIAA